MATCLRWQTAAHTRGPPQGWPGALHGDKGRGCRPDARACRTRAGPLPPGDEDDDSGRGRGGGGASTVHCSVLCCLEVARPTRQKGRPRPHRRQQQHPLLLWAPIGQTTTQHSLVTKLRHPEPSHFSCTVRLKCVCGLGGARTCKCDSSDRRSLENRWVFCALDAPNTRPPPSSERSSHCTCTSRVRARRASRAALGWACPFTAGTCRARILGGLRRP